MIENFREKLTEMLSVDGMKEHVEGLGYEIIESEGHLTLLAKQDREIKIVYEDKYKINYDEETMIATISEKTTVGHAAAREGLSVEEFLGSLVEVEENNENK